MDLDNTTRFPALLFRGCIDEHRLFGSVAARVTYDLLGQTLVPAATQSWPISPGPWDSPHGPMEGDELFYRGGVDLFVFGSAQSGRRKTCPGGRRDCSSRLKVYCLRPSVRRAPLGKTRQCLRDVYSEAV